MGIYVANTISGLHCSQCDRPVREYCVPDDVWNAVVFREIPKTYHECLCVWCFVDAACSYIMERDAGDAT